MMKEITSAFGRYHLFIICMWNSVFWSSFIVKIFQIAGRTGSSYSLTCLNKLWLKRRKHASLVSTTKFWKNFWDLRHRDLKFQNWIPTEFKKLLNPYSVLALIMIPAKIYIQYLSTQVFESLAERFLPWPPLAFCRSNGIYDLSRLYSELEQNGNQFSFQSFQYMHFQFCHV